MFRQAGIAVGVAALGALVPAGAAFGDGSPQSYVDGFHDALWVGAVARAGGRRRHRAADPRAPPGDGPRRRRARGGLSGRTAPATSAATASSTATAVSARSTVIWSPRKPISGGPARKAQ